MTSSESPSGEQRGSKGAEPLLQRVRDLASAATEDQVCARALGNGLVFSVQEYLDRTSIPEDVELFFETHGREPADVRSWPGAILGALSHRGLNPPELDAVLDQAVQRAAALIETGSPLAWGTSQPGGHPSN